MHVFIVGAGKMGTFLAADLRARGHTVSVMERRAETAALATKELGFHVAIGDGTELATLRGSPMRQADAVVAATGEDEDNLVVCLLAKTEFGVKRTIARVNHPKNEWLFTQVLGVDMCLSQSHHIARLVEDELDSLSPAP
ncbi:MAG: TrkA family potassium uptake protein [Chloroflexi bacterium]|nr:TrkA family potassium uptake protein [Chloroflexota bacterium]